MYSFAQGQFPDAQKTFFIKFFLFQEYSIIILVFFSGQWRNQEHTYFLKSEQSHTKTLFYKFIHMKYSNKAICSGAYEIWEVFFDDDDGVALSFFTCLMVSKRTKIIHFIIWHLEAFKKGRIRIPFTFPCLSVWTGMLTTT